MIINLPKWASKITNGMSVTVWPFIFIAHEHRGIDDVLDHERVHYERQAWKSPVWIYKYFKSPEYRLEQEKAGYRETIASLIRAGDPVNVHIIALNLSEKYWGMIQYEEALIWANRTNREERDKSIDSFINKIIKK
jgi:hypothetical protein